MAKLRGTPEDDEIRGTDDADRIDSLKGDDRVVGEAGDDVIHGGAGSDSLVGGDGGDRLQGGAGNDDLEGDEGNDVLQGGAGDDRLRGHQGDDRLTGGAGRDTFEYFHDWDISSDYGIIDLGDDAILDFTPGTDRLSIYVFGGGESFSGLGMLDSNGDQRVDAQDINVDMAMVDAGGGARASLRLDVSGSLDRLDPVGFPGDAVLTLVGVTSLAPEDFV
jgi:Ca2+-binding RTX toxin-like protein